MVRCDLSRGIDYFIIGCYFGLINYVNYLLKYYQIEFIYSHGIRMFKTQGCQCLGVVRLVPSRHVRPLSFRLPSLTIIILQVVLIIPQVGYRYYF